MKKRPNGYWKDFETLRAYLLPKCNEVGRMLITREILEIKGLNHAIKLHGGIREVTKKLNITPSSNFKTPSGNIVKSSYEVILDNFLHLNGLNYKYEGKISEDNNYLFDFKVGDFFIEIWGYRKSETYKINKKYAESRTKKEQLYKSKNLKLISFNYDFFTRNIKEIYCDLKNIFNMHCIKCNDFCAKELYKLTQFESFGKDEILNELFSYFKKLNINKFPSKKWWCENGFQKHINFLDAHKITISYILNKFNIKESHINKINKFRDWEYCKKELSKIYLDISSFPTQKFLIDNNHKSLLKAVYRYHNGLESCALNMDISLKNKPNCYWLNFENLKKEITHIINDNKKFPTTNYLREINREDIINAIYKYHGGILNVKKQILK